MMEGRISGLYLLLVVLLVFNDCYCLKVLAPSVSSVSSVSSISRFSSSISRLSSSKGDDYEGMKIDKSKLDNKEKERIAYIEKLSLEADDMVKAAGFRLDDMDVYDKEVIDTQWTGQSGLEVSFLSEKNFNDITKRWGLLIGDIIALLAFATIGRGNHGEGLDIIGILGTATPFIISWISISPFLGAYTRETTSSKGSVFTGIIPAWAVSIPLALALRGLIKGAIPPTPFIIVSLISTYVLLSIWRYSYVVLVGETSDKEYKTAGFFEVFKMVGTLMKRW